MKIILTLILTLVTSAAWAGSFTIPTTAAQDAAITAIVTALNAQRAVEKPPRPPLTELDYVNSVVLPMFDQWVAQQQATKTTPIVESLKTATDVQLQAVRDALK